MNTFEKQTISEKFEFRQKAGAALSADVIQRIPELARQGLSIRHVAGHLRIGTSTVQRVLAKLKERGGRRLDFARGRNTSTSEKSSTLVSEA